MNAMSQNANNVQTTILRTIIIESIKFSLAWNENVCVRVEYLSDLPSETQPCFQNKLSFSI